MTAEINQKYMEMSETDRKAIFNRPEGWASSFFLGVKEGGGFLPQTEYDQKLFLANDLAL